ncbi:hypothetical protein V6N13_066669 [Hibiscus sabdariffa]|uniref:MADS-box domain-containing protein n=1 Tax=Hibiscus sabdariffa TaxID=183260 RepID=A0ABR2DR54_9ROSI
MNRKKIKITYIKNDVARNVAYKKRRNVMVKKLSELTTLSRVGGCVVLHPSNSDFQLEIYPPTAAARSLFSEHKTLPATRMVNEENFLTQQITEVIEQLKQLQVENRKMELTYIMYQNLGREGPLNVKKEDLVELKKLIDKELKDIDKRIEALDKQED